MRLKAARHADADASATNPTTACSCGLVEAVKGTRPHVPLQRKFYLSDNNHQGGGVVAGRSAPPSGWVGPAGYSVGRPMEPGA
eukprot:1204500-Amphidinium_carterae.2